MSAAGRGPRGGDETDYFTTPSWCVRRLLEEWQPDNAGNWVEPSAGNGAIIRTVNAIMPVAPRWLAFELREEERATLSALCPTRIGNFLHIDDPPDDSVAVVLGNPPYSHAYQFVVQSHHLFPRAEIILLLRVAFTASQERFAFMRHHMPDEYKLPDRVSFDGGGGDNTDYSWMRWPAKWDRRIGKTRMLNRTPLEERQLDKGHKVIVVPPQLELL